MLLAVGLLAVGVAACGGKKQESGSTETSAQGGNTITITLSDFKIEPATLNLKQGTTYTLVIKNNGPSVHDFAIKDLGVQSPMIDSGKEATVQVTPNKTGTFNAICTVAGHEQLGMKGTVTVQ